MKNNVILVVDDELEIRDALSRHFRFLGYQVKTAANGKDALDFMLKEKVDILISDVLMPVMGGVELLKAVRLQYPMVPVIMMTGYVTQENVLSCMRHGAQTCIFKPWPDMAELENNVKTALDSINTWKHKLRSLREMKPSVGEP